MSKASQPWLCCSLNHSDDQHNETQLLSVWVSNRAWTPCTVHLGCAWGPLLSLDLLLCGKNPPRTHGGKLSSTRESSHITHVQTEIYCPIWTCPYHSSQSWLVNTHTSQTGELPVTFHLSSKPCLGHVHDWWECHRKTPSLTFS